MIEFHESEYFQSPFNWDELRILQQFMSREDYDKLLYVGHRCYNINKEINAKDCRELG